MAESERGQDIIFEFSCDWCEREEGEENEAVGYCATCLEYLCKDCFRRHIRPRIMRHHVLLDQHQMPKGNQTASSPKTFPVVDLEARVSHVSLQQNRDERKPFVQHVINKNVRSRYDTDRPWITGCVVLPGGKLVLVDSNNCKVKLADLKRGQAVSQLKLQDKLWDITMVSSTQVAVTSPDEQIIYFVDVRYKLKKERKVNVKGKCYGIARVHANLVVSYVQPVKVEIISMKGKTLQTVVTEDKGANLFNSPCHIAVSKDQHIIYISDWSSITSVDLNGKIQAKYIDKQLKNPQGLTVDTAGAVYVCGMDSHNVLQLTAGLTEGRQLLQRSDGVLAATSVCYCEATGELFVGTRDDVGKVFKMEE